MKVTFLFLITAILSSCSVKEEYKFQLYPNGEGIQKIGLVKSDKNYLTQNCSTQSRVFKLLVNDKSKDIILSEHLKRYDLELIELFYVQGAMDKYEIRLTQSGCIDSQLSLNFNFNKNFKTSTQVIEAMRRAIKDLEFTNYAQEIQKNTLDAITELALRTKKYCRVDKNFVAYRHRTFCTFKSDELHYQMIWGILEDGEEIINLTSSYSSF